jgi:hypothetical protein
MHACVHTHTQNNVPQSKAQPPDHVHPCLSHVCILRCWVHTCLHHMHTNTNPPATCCHQRMYTLFVLCNLSCSLGWLSLHHCICMYVYIYVCQHEYEPQAGKAEPGSLYMYVCMYVSKNLSHSPGWLRLHHRVTKYPKHTYIHTHTQTLRNSGTYHSSLSLDISLRL